MSKIYERIKLIILEIINVLTDLVCPLISLFMVLAEAVGAPKSFLEKVKKVEYILFNVCATKDKL